MYAHSSQYIFSILFGCRIREAKSDQLPIVDVDGTYMYRKQQRLTESGVINSMSSLNPPSPPLSGWEDLTGANVESIGPKIPVVTSGLI